MRREGGWGGRELRTNNGKKSPTRFGCFLFFFFFFFFSFLIPHSAWFWGGEFELPVKTQGAKARGWGEGGEGKERGSTLSECLLSMNGWPRSAGPRAPAAPRSRRRWAAAGCRGMSARGGASSASVLAFSLASQVSVRCVSHLLLHLTCTRNFPRVGPRVTSLKSCQL